MREIYCIKCKKYKNLKNLKYNILIIMKHFFSSICNKCGSEDEQIFMVE